MGFAKEYSRWFEKLSRKLLAEQLNLPEESIRLTQEHKDGGLDGLSELSLGSIFEQKLNYNLAFEAKLKSDRYNAGLDIFAKAMIIAFNSTHHGLAICTNRKFTPQCIKEAGRFCMKTGLKFLFVDGPRVSSWILKNKNKLNNEGYPEMFLKGLLWEGESNNPEEKAQNYKHILEPDFCYFPKTEVSVTWEGAGGNVKLIGNISTKALSTEKQNLDELIGFHRKNVVKSVKASVVKVFGIHLLWGEAGVGKSLAVSHVAENCIELGWVTDSIDLSTCFTSRDLFIRLLSILVGTNLSTALAQVGGNEANIFIRQLLGNTDVDENDINATVSVLQYSAEEHVERSDLNHAVLVTLLEHIIACRTRNGLKTPPLLLVLQEITRATPELLDFTSRVLVILPRGNISVLIESRFKDQQSDSSKHWESFRTGIALASTTEHVLEVPTTFDAKKHVEHLLPGIGSERAEIIVKRVGNTPLFLGAAVDYLIAMNAVKLHNCKYAVVEDLETFFEGISPKKPIGILKRQVGYWWQNYSSALHAFALLDGKLPIGILNEVLGELSDEFFEILPKMHLFNISSDLEFVELRHSLLLDVVKESSEDSIFTRKQTALKLLGRIDEFERDSLILEARKADLFAATGNFLKAAPLAFRTGNQFWQQHQLNLADRYLKLAYKLNRQMFEEGSILTNSDLINALLTLLELRDQRYRLGMEECKELLSDANNIWEKAKQNNEILKSGLRAGYILWRAEHIQERFKRAECLGKSLNELIATNLSEAEFLPGEITGNALSSLGITLKAMGKSEESKVVFQKAVNQFPNSVELEIQYHSNLAALTLAKEPEIAMPHYEHIIKLTNPSGPQFLVHLHARVDVAMVEFLTGNYSVGLEKALLANNLASANGVAAQTARALNIAGCCAWAEQNTKEALNYFQQAVLNAEKSFSDRFLWRMRTNLASVSLECQQVDSALANAVSAGNRILSPRLKNWNTESLDLSNRWYQALVQCGVVLSCLSEKDLLMSLVNKIPEPDYLKHVVEVSQGRFPENIFTNASCIHAGKIMITG